MQQNDHNAPDQRVAEQPAGGPSGALGSGRPTVVDAHQHFWRYNADQYPWMSGGALALARDYEPHDLQPLLAATGVGATIAVQARQLAVENDYLLSLADAHDWVRGVVGWVDFADAGVDSQLERYAAHPAFCGVRELIHDMADVDYATSRAHRDGVGRLAQYGLTYDLLVKPQHLAAAVRLVDALPNQRFVVDHIAKPDIKAGQFEPWAGQLRDLARRPNVYCKLSGMVTEADRQNLQLEQFRRYLEHCLAIFGADRLMFGSDWPVCTLAAEYAAVVGLVRAFVADLTVAEQVAILAENCLRFYGLDTRQ